MEYRWSVSLFDKHIEEYKKLHKQISIFNSSEKMNVNIAFISWKT